MGNKDCDLFDEDEILEQGDYYEDDGFAEIENSPNREQIDSLKESKTPGIVVTILKWIVGKIFTIVIILIVFVFIFLGYKVLSYMNNADADIGGVNGAVEALDW